MKPADELRRLEERVQRGRAYNTLAEEECDRILERMDFLWTLLSPEERDEVNARHARVAKIMRRKELAAHDVPVSKQVPAFPRERAVA